MTRSRSIHLNLKIERSQLEGNKEEESKHKTIQAVTSGPKIMVLNYDDYMNIINDKELCEKIKEFKVETLIPPIWKIEHVPTNMNRIPREEESKQSPKRLRRPRM